MSHAEAAVQRERASRLRSLAVRMRTTPAMSLHLHAGVDTWYGPRAEACTSDLSRIQRAVATAADDLDLRARWLDRTADELTVAALRAEHETRMPPTT